MSRRDDLGAEIDARIQEEELRSLQRAIKHHKTSLAKRASSFSLLEGKQNLDPVVRALLKRRRNAEEQQQAWLQDKQRERLQKRQKDMAELRLLQDDLLQRSSSDMQTDRKLSDVDESSSTIPPSAPQSAPSTKKKSKKPPPPSKPPPPPPKAPPSNAPPAAQARFAFPAQDTDEPAFSSLHRVNEDDDSNNPLAFPPLPPMPSETSLFFNDSSSGLQTPAALTQSSMSFSSTQFANAHASLSGPVSDDYIVIGDPKLMFIQILVPKQFTGQTAGEQPSVKNYTELRIAYANFESRRFEIWDKGSSVVLEVEFKDMLGHNSDDNDPKLFYLYRDQLRRWTFMVQSMQDVTLMDSLLYAAEVNDTRRLKNIQTYFSTKVMRKGTLGLRVQTMAGLSQGYQDRSITIIAGKMLVFKKGCVMPSMALSLYGSQVKYVRGSKDFDYVHQEGDTHNFRAASPEEAQDWVSLLERVLEMGDFELSLDIAPAELVTRVLHPTLGHTVDESSRNATGSRLRARNSLNVDTSGTRITSSTSTLGANFDSGAASSKPKGGLIKKMSSWRVSKRASTETGSRLNPMMEEGIIAVVDLNDNTWAQRFIILKNDILYIYPKEFMNQRSDDAEPVADVNLQECSLIDDSEPLLFASKTAPPEFTGHIWPIKFEDKDVMFVADTQEKQKMWREALKMCMDTVFQNQRSALLLGTVEELVTTLLNSSQIDPEYTAAFLHTFQSFMKPQDLLTSIEGRLFVSYDIDVAEIPETIWRKTVLKPTQQRCVHVLQQWMAVMAIDFIEEPGLLNATIELADRLAAEGLTLFADQLTESIKSVESTREGKREVAMLAKQKTAKMLGMDTPEAKIPKNIRNTITFMDCDPEEVARQLCVMDFKAYERIKPIELINRAWARSKRASAATDDDEPEASNVTSFIAQFNHISLYIANTICSVERLKERSIVYGRVVQLCGYLYHMQSFNMLKSCLAGMNMAPVFRLKHTKANLSKRVLSLVTEMETNMSSDKAHKRYREIIGEADAPCIPFLGVCLTDLTFVGDGNPNMVDGKHNFSKRKVAYGIISQFTKFQSSSFQFQPVIQIQNMLLNTTALKKEDELYSMSLALEPRGSKKSDILQ
eukprot:c10558_g1_i1.p1 GENE.c10558_g1_i1~~c10558_g1_i1.p1  ORF type:complete len:1114 (-),score=363.35 c10558_g1_i1:345-3686(-)